LVLAVKRNKTGISDKTTEESLMSNPFVLAPEEYTRDIDIVKAFVNQNALYLHLETGDPVEECRKFVKDTIRPGAPNGIKDPIIVSLEQTSPGNRERVDRSFLEYIKIVTESERILSPSMVCYEQAAVNKSTSAAYIEGGINERGVAKKEMFVARQQNNHILEYIKDCEQNAKKIGINSVSGMHGFEGNILYVKSGHSSLTSMCRTASGYGNAINERFIGGSRHYWHVDIVIANMLTIMSNTDYDLLQEAVDKYSIHLPTIDQTMECIEWSTRLYWRNAVELARCKSLVEKMSGIQRAAFVYSGDMYHLMKYNEPLVRDFMDSLICPDLSGVVINDPDAVLSENARDPDRAAYVNLLGSVILDGRTRAMLKAEDPEGYLQLARIAQNVGTVILQYSSLIRALWVPKHLPPTVANIRSIIRRVVIAGDTDSTIFTTQLWGEWYTGSSKRSEKSDGIWHTVTYLTTQCIIHVMAQFSGNMGVAPSDIHRLSMKNEYAFPVFSLTSRAKHYYAYMSAREGNVYKEYDHEIKGVALRSSIVPVDIIKRAKELMFEVLTAADNGDQLELRYVYDVIWKFEQEIIASIAKGEPRFLKTGQVKPVYKNMESSPFQHYNLWETVFAPKYGSTVEPPYSVIKVPLNINNKTEMAEWLLSFGDVEMCQRFSKWMDDRNKDKMSTLLLPTSLLGIRGMPVEIMPAINVRKLTYEILESFYLILESLGVYQIDENFIRLVSDVYTPNMAEIKPMV
jgi:hypothetical protein